MKKTLGLLLAAAMLFTVIAPSTFAADTEAYKQVLSVVKERFGIEGESKSFDSSTHKDAGTVVYDFTWTYDDSMEINVSCGEDKVVRSYSRYDSDESYDNDRAFQKYDRADYEKSARDILEKINPEIADNLIFENTDGRAMWGNRVEVPFVFEKNGMKIDEFSGNITLDSQTKELKNFYINNYFAADMPEQSQLISKDEAVSAYKNLFGMKLVYDIKTDYDKREKTAVPKYVPAAEYNEYVNAVTGEKYEYKYYFRGLAGGGSKEAAMDSMASDNGFSEQEIAEIGNIEGLLSASQIEKEIRANKLFNIKSSDKVTNCSLRKDIFDDSYCYSMIFRNGETRSFYVSADARTGEIRNYSGYTDGEAKSKISEGKAAETAEDYAKTLAGDKFAEYEKIAGEGYSVTYVRKVNGAQVLGDTLNVSVDEEGKLNWYSIGYTEVEFPALDGIIDAEKACDIMFANVKYEPYGLIERNLEYQPEKAVAVYKIDGNTEIDPFTGEVIKPDYAVDSEPITYTDIEGHYAQAQIEKLAQYGIGLKGGKFNPDGNITQKDYITLLSKAYNNYRGSDDELYRYAERNGIIKKDEVNDTAPVTRMEAAIFMVRAMGAEKYAELQGIWNCPFADITENQGYASLLYGMSIIKGDEAGNFNPDAYITNADSAIIIYNSLNK